MHTGLCNNKDCVCREYLLKQGLSVQTKMTSVFTKKCQQLTFEGFYQTFQALLSQPPTHAILASRLDSLHVAD